MTAPVIPLHRMAGATKDYAAIGWTKPEAYPTDPDALLCMGTISEAKYEIESIRARLNGSPRTARFKAPASQSVLPDFFRKWSGLIGVGMCALSAVVAIYFVAQIVRVM